MLVVILSADAKILADCMPLLNTFAVYSQLKRTQFRENRPESSGLISFSGLPESRKHEWHEALMRLQKAELATQQQQQQQQQQRQQQDRQRNGSSRRTTTTAAATTTEQQHLYDSV